MDVSGDFHYSDPDRPGPIMVAAARVTIAVPVTGQAKMLGEIELAVLAEQCPDRRLANRATLEREVAAWQAARNASVVVLIGAPPLRMRGSS